MSILVFYGKAKPALLLVYVLPASTEYGNYGDLVLPEDNWDEVLFVMSDMFYPQEIFNINGDLIIKVKFIKLKWL